jgi:hypothetical protein
VGDELKSASRAAADSPLYPRVFGMSLKDRSAVLPAGHMANAAFCLDTKTGAFVTSTYYRADLPAWAAAFNAKKPADAFAGKTWTYLDPAAGSAGTLPPVGDSLYNAVFGSPFGNDLLLSFALTAIEAEQLGQRGVTDLLSVSFSSNDSVGYSFGPDSPQVRDIAVRTDRTIGDLLARVDKLVGLDHTLVVLTADHGVAPVPEVQQQRHLPGGRLTNDEAMTPIATALTAKYGAGNWIIGTAGTSPYLNYALIEEKHLDLVEVRKVAAAAASQLPHVARVYTRDQVLSGQVTPDTIGRRIARARTSRVQAISRSCSTRTGCAPLEGRRTARRTPTTHTFRWSSWDRASARDITMRTWRSTTWRQRSRRSSPWRPRQARRGAC